MIRWKAVLKLRFPIFWQTVRVSVQNVKPLFDRARKLRMTLFGTHHNEPKQGQPAKETANDEQVAWNDYLSGEETPERLRVT